MEAWSLEEIYRISLSPRLNPYIQITTTMSSSGNPRMARLMGYVQKQPLKANNQVQMMAAGAAALAGGAIYMMSGSDSSSNCEYFWSRLAHSSAASCIQLPHSSFTYTYLTLTNLDLTAKKSGDGNPIAQKMMPENRTRAAAATNEGVSSDKYTN
jgi:hypothetical protein